MKQRLKRFNFELPDELNAKIEAGTKKTGISGAALAKLCLAAGLAQLERGELKVQAIQPDATR